VLAYEVYGGLRQSRAAVRGELPNWDQATYAVVAAATVAGKLLGLDREQLGHAIGLAAASHMTLGVVRGAVQLSHWKGSAVANASRNAVFCAGLAAKGLSGPDPVFESANGFFQALGTSLDFEPLDSSAGTPRIMQSQIKAFPAGTYAQGPGSAAARLHARLGEIAPIREVRVHTTPRGISAMGSRASRWRPETRETADHSLPFAVAMILLEGTLEVRHFDDAYYARPEVQAFMEKIRLIPIKQDNLGWHVVPTSTVEVELESGEVVTETVVDPLGHPRNPMTPADAARKFRSLVAPVLPERQVDQLLNALRGLDDVNDIRSVMSLTVRP
jgi:2-methylcitrate dehydratase